jgi:hypothetical protein
MLEKKFYCSRKCVSRKLSFAYAAVLLMCVLMTGCGADPVSKVKNGVLEYDTSTTFGQALKGMMNKQDVKWEKIKDTSGRTSVKCSISLSDSDGFFYPTSYLDYEIDPSVRFAKMDDLVYKLYKQTVWNFMALGKQSGLFSEDQELADMFVKYESLYDSADGGTNESGERFFFYGDTLITGEFLFDVNGDFSLNDCRLISSISAPSMDKMTIINSTLKPDDFLDVIYKNANYWDIVLKRVQ